MGGSEKSICVCVCMCVLAYACVNGGGKRNRGRDVLMICATWGYDDMKETTISSVDLTESERAGRNDLRNKTPAICSSINNIHLSNRLSSSLYGFTRHSGYKKMLALNSLGKRLRALA